MVLTTSQLRAAYGPHCQARDWGMELAYAALDICLKFFNYGPRAVDTGSYNCRPITGGTAYSLHAFRDDGTFVFWTMVKVTMALAVDINWQANPYGPRLITDMPREMVDAILAIRTNSGERVWGWGGYYSGNKDAMHYEIVCTPAALRSGINPATLPSHTPEPPVLEENDMGTTAIYAQQDGTLRAVVIGEDSKAYHYVGTKDPMTLINAVGQALPGGWKSLSAMVIPGTEIEIVWGHGLDNGAWFTFWQRDKGWQGPFRQKFAKLLN